MEKKKSITKKNRAEGQDEILEMRGETELWRIKCVSGCASREGGGGGTGGIGGEGGYAKGRRRGR